MDPGALVVGFVVGAALAALAVWGSARGRAERLAERADRVPELERELDERVRELATLGEERATLTSRLEAERAVAAERERAFNDAGLRLREAFAALAGEALQRNSDGFLKVAREIFEGDRKSADASLAARQQAIDALVTPVREKLAELGDKLGSLDRERGAREAQFQSLDGTTKQLLAQTSQLAQALRAPGVRGRWGELQLRRIVDLAGMLEHCDFEEQEAAEGDRASRPDAVVKLAGGRHLIVDAKVVLDAFLKANEATDDDGRERHLAAHARQVRTRIDQLASKAYWQQFPRTPEFVVMFVPGEAQLAAALQTDPDLIAHAFDHRVVLASPLILLAILQGSAIGWQEKRTEENALRIGELAGELHDRLATLLEHFERLGRRLSQAVEAHNAAIGSYETQLLPKARELVELGARGHKARPDLSPIDIAVRAPRTAAGPSEDDAGTPGGPA